MNTQPANHQALSSKQLLKDTASTTDSIKDFSSLPSTSPITLNPILFKPNSVPIFSHKEESDISTKCSHTNSVSYKDSVDLTNFFYEIMNGSGSFKQNKKASFLESDEKTTERKDSFHSEDNYVSDEINRNDDFNDCLEEDVSSLESFDIDEDFIMNFKVEEMEVKSICDAKCGKRDLNEFLKGVDEDVEDGGLNGLGN